MADHNLPTDWKTSYRHFIIPLRPGKLSNYSVYNVDYYPEHVKTLLYRAEDIHALVLFYGLNYAKQLLFDIRNFRAELSRRIKLRRSPRNWPKDWKQMAVCQLGTSSAVFFGFVISAKALLDVMATVWHKTADEKASTMTFNKAKIGSDVEVIAGGKLINWFRNSCPSEFTDRIEAAAILERHSREWITELVTYRDNFNHHGGVPDMTPLCVVLDLDNVESDENGTFPRTKYHEQEIIKPALPTDQVVGDFVSSIGTRIQEMMREMAGLFASDRPRTSHRIPKPGDRWYIADELLEEH